MKARKGFSDAEKRMMKLPRETQDGIHITGMLVYICVYVYLSHLIFFFSIIFCRVHTLHIQQDSWCL